MHNLHLLERFLAVVKTGSIGKAAKQLGITSPSLTKSIRKLETSYGVELFERHSKGVSLSPFGERILSHVRVIDREIQFAEAEIDTFREGLRGVFRIGAIPVWGYNLLPFAIAKMHEKYPAVRIDLTIGTLARMVPEIQNGAIDILAGADAANIDELPPFLERSEGPKIHLHLVAGREHPCHERAPEKLLDYPWVMFGNDPHNLDAFSRRIQEITGGVPTFAMTSQSIIAVAEILKSGDYISWMAEPVLDFVGDESIRRIESAEPFLSINSCLIYRRSLNGVAAFNVLKRNCAPNRNLGALEHQLLI